MTEESPANLLAATVTLAIAYFSRNSVPSEQISQILTDIHGSLAGLGQTSAELEPLKPAVSIRRSITPDYIVCLEDGKQLKMLKRHLRTTYDMTPEQYRSKWGLPTDYPMVAPNYAKSRSEFAKKIGLGRKAAQPAPRRSPRTKKAPATGG
ncbi:MAG: MucR family transcriptional regulator [Parvibaculum sp.]